MDRLAFLAPLFAFSNPRRAWIAAIIFGFVIVMVLAPVDHVEKFGFTLAMGFGIGYLGVGGKALMSKFSNLAVVMCACGVAMLGSAALETPPSFLVASTLDDHAALIIGAGMTFFSSIEEG